jgi:lipoate-protein ligase B
MADSMLNIIEWSDLGTISYKRAWALQDKLREERIAGRIADRLLLVEHPPVFTMGKRDCEDDFFSTPEAIAAEGIEIVKTNRGGRVTYHGPGQLVGYFICELASFGIGIKEFVFAVEEICIRLLAAAGIDGSRDAEHPGIWVGRSKLVAVGMNVQHGVTQHGLALNVNCDLTPYRHIVACGIRDRGVTSMKTLLRDVPAMDEVKQRFLAKTGDVLGRRLVERKGD